MSPDDLAEDEDDGAAQPPPALLMSDFAKRLVAADNPGLPLWLAERALLLLDRGRIGPLRALLRELPAAITGTAEAVYAEGRWRGREEAEKRVKAAAPRRAAKRSASTAFHRDALELARHVARLGAARAAAILGVGLGDLSPLLEGRVKPPASGLRRLRETPC